MKDRLLELKHKYDKQLDGKIIRIDTDDFLELMGIAEYSCALYDELSEE